MTVEGAEACATHENERAIHGTEGEKGLAAVRRVCAPCTRSLGSALPRPRAPLITCPGVLALESYSKLSLLSLWAALIHSRAPEPFRSLAEKRLWHGLGCSLLRGRPAGRSTTLVYTGWERELAVQRMNEVAFGTR